MSAIDIFYLSLVLVAFSVFASALAYYTQRDRLPRNRPVDTSRKPAPAPAAAVKATKVHEHA
jgi:hypothetical protein